MNSEIKTFTLNFGDFMGDGREVKASFELVMRGLPHDGLIGAIQLTLKVSAREPIDLIARVAVEKLGEVLTCAANELRV
jgi:hypothetical protein